jgi:hypothetical protein
MRALKCYVKKHSNSTEAIALQLLNQCGHDRAKLMKEIYKKSFSGQIYSTSNCTGSWFFRSKSMCRAVDSIENMENLPSANKEGARLYKIRAAFGK